MSSDGVLKASGTAAFLLFYRPAFALDTTESIGAEKCGRAAKNYAVEFLAPDSATVEATRR